MAPPRIFVSSTFYDLRYVRADLQHFESEAGFDLVLFERGNIPYDGRQSLEDGCLEEIQKCDIVVSIIGRRHGTPSKTDPDRSISRREFECAIELGRQVFVFVERVVLDEFETYLINADRASEIKWRFVDSLQVFEFIKYVQGLPINNAIFPFDTSQELIAKLREQVAGLFRNMLHQQRRGKYDTNVNKLVESVETLNRVIDYLRAEKNAEKKVMDDILFSRHPAFAEVQRVIELPIRVMFEDLHDLEALFNYAGFKRVGVKELSPEDSARFFFWAGPVSGRQKRVGVNKRLFEAPGSDQMDGANPKLLAVTEQDIASMDMVVVR